MMLFGIILFGVVSGFYVPGVAPIDFKKSEQVEIRAVKMTSSKTQLPYEYYSLPFCQPEGGVNYQVNFYSITIRHLKLASRH